MDRVLHPHAAYTAVYLDDVIIHSSSQVEHMQRVAALVESLRQTGLTVNPKNYAVGLAQDQKGGEVVLGIAGYYQRLLLSFADLTSPLTGLTHNGESDPLQ